MKKNIIFQVAVVLLLVLVFVSCRSGREYSYYPHRTSASFSLIVNPGPGIYENRYPNGLYYYRSPQGYIYWRGYDNRYYLDRSYLGKGHYDTREYNQWRKYYNRHGRRYH